MSILSTESFSIIGSESQTIRILLKKNEKININTKYLISSSSNDFREIIYYKQNQIIQRNTQENSDNNLLKIDDESIINIKNTKGNIEYLCLSKGGKIMVINPKFYNNLYIKLDSLLAFNNGIELYFDKERNKKFDTFFFYRTLYKGGNIRRRDMYFFDYSSTYQFCLIKPKLNSNIEKESFQNLSSFIFDNNNSLNDLLFISGKGPLFEKRLGEGESMILSEKNIIAFEGSITFEMIPKKQNDLKKYVNVLNHLIVMGPGLVIFEIGQKIDYDNISVKKKKFLVIILVVLMHLLVFLMFLIN